MINKLYILTINATTKKEFLKKFTKKRKISQNINTLYKNPA